MRNHLKPVLGVLAVAALLGGVVWVAVPAGSAVPPTECERALDWAALTESALNRNTNDGVGRRQTLEADLRNWIADVRVSCAPPVTTTTAAPTTTTAAPTTTTVEPTTTTAPATTTTTAPPVTTTTVPPGGACMPNPSSCGYPDESNTGVPPGTALTVVNGDVHLATAGATYSNREVHGSIYVEASNVTIANVRIIGGAYYPIRTFGAGNPTGTVVRDTEIDFDGFDQAKGIAFSNYRAERVWFHNGMDCAHFGNNVVIVDSFCDLNPMIAGSDAHADGFQSDGGNNIVIRHNTIRNPNGQTAAILMSTNTSGIGNVTVDNNLMSGGGYTLYCDAGPDVPNGVFTNNRFSREFHPQGGYWGPTTGCEDDVFTGNVWDETGAPL